MTEQIDNRFIKYNFDDDGGNLYKEIWPLRMDGQPFSDAQYLGALKTNEDEDPNVDIIKEIASALANSEGENARSVVEKYMDIDQTISYAVVDRLIRHDDGPFHWYCSNGWCSSHNFYFYEAPESRKLHLIPWDLDNAFENIIYDVNPVTPIVDEWGQTSNNCEPFAGGPWGIPQWSASCDKLTATWASYEELYASKKKDLIEGPFAEQRITSQLNKWEAQIRQATKEADELHSDAITVEEWESAIETLLQQITYARNN